MLESSSVTVCAQYCIKCIEQMLCGMQVDLRLAQDAQEGLKQRMAQMFNARDVDGGAASTALKAAYHDVTRKKILCTSSRLADQR